MVFFFFFKQKTAYELRISDWSSDVCSSDLMPAIAAALIIWLQALVACPAPTPPICVIRPAKQVRIGRARSTSAGSPPAITASVPARAPDGPPDTGDRKSAV